MADKTTDYKKFKYMNGNRQVSKKRVDNIAASMAVHPDIFPIRPILVNEQFEIIDGQHRFSAAKKLGVPVWYEVAKNIGHDEALILNQNQANWQLLDYAKSYAWAGKQSYKDFLKVIHDHPGVPVHVVIAYIGGNAKNTTTVFRQGKFEAKSLGFGELFLDYLKEFADYQPKAKLQTPARALFKVFQTEGYDHDRMLAKLAMAPEGTFKPYGTLREVLRSLEDLYNWRQQKDIVRFYE